MSNHTKGLLELGPHLSIVGGPIRAMNSGAEIKGQLFSPCAQDWMVPGEMVDNTRRAIASWNFCEDITTEQLETMDLAGAVRQRDSLVIALKLMLERMDAVPEAACYCHLSPPCNDCVEHGGIREAIEVAESALSSIKEAQ